MSYRRHNKVLIGGKSRDLGKTNILVSKKKGGITPRNLSLAGQLRTNGNWDLQAVWLPPTIDSPAPTGYSIEIQQTVIALPALPVWASLSTTASLTFTFSNFPEGIYKVRVRTEFASGPSEWVESDTVNAFINLSYDLSNSPHFHTLIV